jgi:hypothetical protein
MPRRGDELTALDQPARTCSRFDIAGKQERLSCGRPVRAAAAPRSRSQYHSANPITFVSQMTPPAASSTATAAKAADTGGNHPQMGDVTLAAA